MLRMGIRKIGSYLEKMKNRGKDCHETGNRNGGFSLIELLIAISVLAIVSAMLVQLLSAAVSLHRKTMVTSQLQKSSQMISRRLDSAIMNARSLYYQVDGNENAFLYMGDTLPGQDNASFRGALLWFDAASNSVYYCDHADITASQGNRLTTADVKNAIEGENAANRNYLLSTNVSGLTFELPSYMKDRRRNASTEDCLYSADTSPAVTYQLSLQHISGMTYEISNSAVARNRLKGIWWPADAIAAEHRAESTAE
jgi:prepilin-type N-terminal cleavage/methylation domain-containing protein